MAVTDLTNTKWLINSTNCAAGYGQFNINYNVYDPGSGAVIGQDGQLFVGYRWVPSSETFAPQANVVMSPMSIMVIQADMTIEIIDGTDVTNASLISWLTANATQITTGGSMYFGTSNISKMYLGQAEVSKVYLGQDLVYEKQASGYNIHLKRTGDNFDTSAEYKLNDGSTTTLAYNSEVILNGVFKLEVLLEWMDSGTIEIGTTGYESTDIFFKSDDMTWTDITQYLQNGCYVTLNCQS